MPAVTMDDIKAYNDFFLKPDLTVIEIIVNIIEDRKYNVPEWFQKYITSDVITTLLNRAEPEGEMRYKLRELVAKVINDKFSDIKYLCKCMVDCEYYDMLALIRPKVLKKYVLSCDIPSDNYDEYIRDFINNVVAKYQLYNNTNDVPVEYIHIINHISGLNTKPFKKSKSKYIQTYFQYIPNLYTKYKDSMNKRVIDNIIETIYPIYADTTIWERMRAYYLMVCWSCGIDFVPVDMRPVEFINYLCIHKDTRYGAEFRDELIPIVFRVLTYPTIDKGEIDVIKSMIMGEVLVNFNNHKVVNWELNKCEISIMNNSYKSEYTTKVTNYDHFHELMVKYNNKPRGVSLDEYIFAYTEKKCRDISKSIINVVDYDRYTEFMFTKCDKCDLSESLRQDELIPTFNKSSNTSLLKYVIDNYIIPQSDARIVNRFIEVVMGDNYLINVITEKQYMNIHQLTGLLRFGISDVLKSYPNLIEFYEFIPAVVLREVLANNESVVHECPWNLIPQEIILKEVAKNGYFSIFEQRDSIVPYIHHPARYIDTDKLLDVIKNYDGNGIGYCIEYSMTPYIKQVLKAIYDHYSKKK